MKGQGLFTSRPIMEGEVIVEFQGEWIDHRQYRVRVDKGHGGYMIEVGKGLYLDCYPFRNICKASMANSVENAYDSTTQQMAKKNSYLMKNKSTKRVFLKATKNIVPHGEILYNYWYDSSEDYPDVLIRQSDVALSNSTPDSSDDSTSDEDYICS